jgi:hypothetical protein
MEEDRWCLEQAIIIALPNGFSWSVFWYDFFWIQHSKVFVRLGFL